MSGIRNNLSKVFEKEAPLSINRVKCHDYLGMVLDFSRIGKVSITMKDYIKDIIINLPNDVI